MYPNSIVAYNIFATTMIGKVIIPNYIPEITYDEDMGKEYIEDVICGDLLHLGHKWHKLSNIEQLDKKLKAKYGNRIGGN